MPTPVSVARQCLTPEAAHALDEAVVVARRRGHAQTTSLHAVSAILSLPSSSLRDACARARNSTYSPRLQVKALELCLGVSLDRVSSTQLSDDPPVSNSLMAAIKRSQANQRRQPENYHLYHQVPQQSSISCVKVELQHLTLSILDDPVVSRVFGEAGFRSSEIKLAILRPFSQLLRYSRYRGPPVFLCNLTEYSGSRSPGFPFPGFPGFSPDGDGECRRIAEILGRNKGKNPLLVGVCAYDALRNFTEVIERRKDGILPQELSGLSVISIEKDVSKFLIEDFDIGFLNSKFRELSELVDRCSGPGLVVNFGDLKLLVDVNSSGDSISNVVKQLTRLMELYAGKVWLIGATGSYESYLKFVSRFPSIEKDWDLHLLPITSLRSSMAESYPRSSLMESFVPFGGFFSAPSDLKLPLSSSLQCLPRSPQCGENCEQEEVDVSKGSCTSSVAERCQSSLPSWLQMAAVSANKGLDAKTKDDGDLLNGKVTGMQKKWDHYQQIHHTQPSPEANLFPTIVGFQCPDDKIDNASNRSSNDPNIASDDAKCKKLNADMPAADKEMILLSQASIPFPLASKSRPGSFSPESWGKPSKDEDLDSAGIRSPCSLSNSSTGDRSQKSPTSATSVTTDLELGISSSASGNKLEKPQNHHRIEPQCGISACYSDNIDLDNMYVSNHAARSSSQSSSHALPEPFDPRDVKMLYKALSERVAWQWEAVRVISQTIACCRARKEKRHGHGASQRGDIWLNFVGPDGFGKKKIAVALAEVLFGNRENLISVDLSSQDGIRLETKGYDVKFRGKNVVDYVAGEMYKKPLAIIFLENVDKSDVLVRNSLSQAILTGKFSDSYGREVSTNNTIFLTTSTFSKDHSVLASRKESSNYSEERILKTKGGPVKITVECSKGDGGASQNRMVSDTKKEGISNSAIVNKRKLIGVSETLKKHNISEMAKRAHKTSKGTLDLNLPAEDYEAHQTDDGNSENDCVSESTEAWLQDFLDQVDETVVFKPVEFDVLAEKIFREIKNTFHKWVRLDCLLEIDSKVMEKLLAAAYVSERYRAVEDWVDQVLSRGFEEVQKRYNLSAHSIVKLVTCESLSLEDPAPTTTVYLPSSIILN